ncbi:MAG TPA: SH3 domain-containing protein [Nitrosospira sp.]|nr:SH3 domain-containing protein [Nitrosospira sp.]
MDNAGESFLKISFPGSRALGLLLVILLAFPVNAVAGLEFFSIADNGVILYDAPSLKAMKLYAASRGFPVEAIVKVEGWVKVRDSEGTLAWVEAKGLSDKRHVIVTAPVAEVYQAPDSSSPLLFQAQQGVIMEWLEPVGAGWVGVRHPDGQNGYVRTTQVWGS